ncbi:High-affinity glucose transporter ght2 [Colletotrichum siamense]|uniref:High-affinity glucose transporter ght2 n=1 Tax=Colletotrichum siamense TaxID=690259 RepID=UPI0018731FAB|nr:High-affinity glucose transporter ght2 [Colletotrichum siamense]KAF5510567.1 High-affinity glucose transporter ght2 [Colletotrichum siamense]
MFGHLKLRKTFNRSLFTTVMLIAVSQFNFGFDQQGFNSTQAMDAFERQFGWYNPQKKVYYLESWWLSLFAGLPYIGFGIGILIGSSVSKRFGRRMCMFSMSVWSCIATTVIMTSKSRDQILAARILAYIYIGMELAVVPIYQSEITPQCARGFVVGTYQLSLASELVGRVPDPIWTLLSSAADSDSWHLSPRWLAMQGRNEEALIALTRLREGKFTEDEIAAEMAHIRAGIDREVEKGKFKDMFHGKQMTKRTMSVIGVNFFMQATGSILASVYGAIFVKQLGFINPFTVTIITSIINIFMCLCAMVLLDKMGRRNVIFFGGSIQTAGLFAMGGLGLTQNPSVPVKSAIVAMMIVMTTGFTLGWAPTSHVLSAEIPSMRLRDITYRTASVVNIVMQFTIAFTLPYLLNAPYANLGSKVGLIFGSIGFLSLVFVYLCVPECKGRTLEEIDTLFEMEVPLRKFQQMDLSRVDAHVSSNKQDVETGSDVVMTLHVGRKD